MTTHVRSQGRRVIVFVVGAFLLGSTPNASSQSGIPTRGLPGVTSSLSGTVVSSITTALVLRDDGGLAHTFFVDSTSALPAGLVPGMRVNVTFEALKGGSAHLVSVGTSYAMNVSEVDSQPQERSAVTPRPSAERKDVPPPVALSTFGLSESLGGPNTEPVQRAPVPRAPVKSEPLKREPVNTEPVRSEPGPSDTAGTLPSMLVTATLSLGVAIAIWWARRLL